MTTNAMIYISTVSNLQLQGRRGAMAGPTLDDVTESVCANGTYHKCLPSGSCYDSQSFCSDKSRSVTSCFPYEIAGDKERLLGFCLHQITNNLTSLIHPACECACINKFGVRALYPCAPCENGNTSDYSWITPTMLCLAICLLVSLVLNIVFFVWFCKTRRGPNSGTVGDGTPDPTQITIQQNAIPKPNSKNNVNGNGEEPGAPPTLDTREADRNRNRSDLNDSNLPTVIRLDQVQYRGSNTQNGGSIHQDEQSHGRSSDTQNETLVNQLDNVHGRSSNTQNGTLVNQLDNVHGRSSNTQNGTLVNQLDNVHDRSSNTQNGTLVNQLDNVDGRSSDARTGGPIDQWDHGCNTGNIPDEQGRYDSQPTASIVSPSSVSFRHNFAGTSEERAALIPRNQALESNDSFSQGQFQRGTSTFSPAIPEAEGRHEVVTSRTVRE